MKVYLGKIVLGSVLCASSMAFAAEPASSSLVLSEQQMDSVTAGTGGSTSFSYTRQSISQRQGGTLNVSFSPTIGANLALLNTGGQNVGSYTYQTGGTQVAVIK